MLDFRTIPDERTGEEILEVPLAGPALLDNPIFNKGSAFPEDERTAFGLHGLLPPHVGSIEEQLDRRYDDFQEKRTELQQHVYLRDLQDRNEVLFYALMRAHIAEMMPLIYTPVVGAACATSAGSTANRAACSCRTSTATRSTRSWRTGRSPRWT